MRTISEKMLDDFRRFLIRSEKSDATIAKYMRDLNTFRNYIITNSDDEEITKEKALGFKEYLENNYKISSANSMLTAVNIFFKYNGWDDCVVKQIKVQRDAFRCDDRNLTIEEYKRLIRAANDNGNERLSLAMQTICSTGIRVSELRFITVEAAECGIAQITNKGKSRMIILIPLLCDRLLEYAEKKNIKAGSIFLARNGKPMDRSKIFHEMKNLSEKANVDRCKIFPHNLRHLFASTYYSQERNIVHLADILGHSDINTTRIYTACTVKDQINVIESLNLVE